MSTLGCAALRPTATMTCGLAFWLFCSQAQALCNWQSNSPTYMTFEHDMGTVWVPRDAEVGRVIADLPMTVRNSEGAALSCFYNASPPTRAMMIPSTPLVVNAPARGQRFTESILRTNIDSVGAVITLAYPYDGSASNTFTSDDGSQEVPYNGTMITPTGFNAPLGTIRGRVRLIKTGPIPPGEHIIDRQMFHGSTDDLGRVMDYILRARVKQAQCTLLGNPVSADPVQLGNYTVADFKGPGPVGTDTPFSITLSDCEDDSAASTAYAHIELDGTRGSNVLDAKRGIFSLGTGSTAAGFGIQVLHGDGRELPLQEAVSVKQLQLGVTQLDFRARFYQLDPTVRPGLAQGALNFTISYR